ncbi:MAG: DUF362 domain-containing protein [Prolixibacteraceae bacterium]|jgi:uncharacterized protein (DUF362 family)|nr:DUF362 domain-containing protein [Prolixibacteraceae bacterium]
MILKPIVSVAGKNGPYLNVIEALKQLDISFLKGKRILIKPNVGRIAPPESGYNTNPDAVAAIIDSLRKVGVATIAIGESPIVGVDTFEAFKRAGFTKMAAKYNVELIDFNSKPPVKVQIPDPRILTETKICQQIYDFDFLISVPVTKTHMHTGVTLGIKNFKGCLYRHEKVRYHQLEYLKKVYPEKTLDSAISDLATVLFPDMVVVDGYIGMEGLGPSGGEPVKSDFAVASFNAMGADVIACKLMGLNAKDVPHLNIISERNKLALEVDEYNVPTEGYERFIHQYNKPPTKISVQFPGVEVQDKDSCSSCLSTLMMFLKRFGEDMSQYALSDGKFHIAIGKGLEKAKVGTVFVGNCTRHMKYKGIHVKGCPPVPTRIYEAIVHHEPDKNEESI